MGSQTSLNPYAPLLGTRDPADVIAATPALIQKWLDEIGPARITAPPAPGKWSGREILCHLADTEIAFAFRLRQALASEHHVVQPFDQDAWAKPYGSFDAGAAAAAFGAIRGWNVTLIRSMSAADRARPVTHPERGSMTIQTIIETMAGHDLNHLRQLEAIAGK